MMNMKSYNVNTREGKLVSFDIDAEEFVVTVLKSAQGTDCTVIDQTHGRMYMVRKSNMQKAVVAYIDWLYGMVNEWIADPDEFGGYEMTEHKIWMSESCDIRECSQLEWECVVEA